MSIHDDLQKTSDLIRYYKLEPHIGAIAASGDGNPHIVLERPIDTFRDLMKGKPVTRNWEYGYAEYKGTIDGCLIIFRDYFDTRKPEPQPEEVQL